MPLITSTKDPYSLQIPNTSCMVNIYEVFGPISPIYRPCSNPNHPILINHNFPNQQYHKTLIFHLPIANLFPSQAPATTPKRPSKYSILLPPAPSSKQAFHIYHFLSQSSLQGAYVTICVYGWQCNLGWTRSVCCLVGLPWFTCPFALFSWAFVREYFFNIEVESEQ